MDIELTQVREISRDVKTYAGRKVSVGGWIRSNRDSKNIGFLVISDGSCFMQLQIVYSDSLTADGGNESKAARESL